MAGISVKTFFLRASAAAPIFSLSRHRDVRHLFYFAPMARCSGGAKSGASAQHCLYGLIFLINKLLMYILNGTRKTTFDIFKLLSSLIQYVQTVLRIRKLLNLRIRIRLDLQSFAGSYPDFLSQWNHSGPTSHLLLLRRNLTKQMQKRERPVTSLN